MGADAGASASTGASTDAGASAGAGAGASAGTYAGAGASAGAGAGAGADANVGLDSGGACPSGMALVDGDYCTDVELTCKKSWYANWNDKTICEKFVPPSRCVGSLVHKRFCIDEYEYPNKKGERPRVMFKFHEAQQLCAAEGKRVCTETEWTTACEGPEHKPYPYGYERDPWACNGDKHYIEPRVTAHDHKGRPIMAFASTRPGSASEELERLWQGRRVSGSAAAVRERLRRLRHARGKVDQLASSETPEPRASSTTSPRAAPGCTACATSAGRRSTRTTRGSRTTTCRRGAAPSPTGLPPIPARPSRSGATRSGARDAAPRSSVKTAHAHDFGPLRRGGGGGGGVRRAGRARCRDADVRARPARQALRGDLAGVSVGLDGVVRAGMTLGAVALPPDTGNTVACAVTLTDGSVLVGTGLAHGGKVVRIAGGVATEYADTKESAVYALAVDRAGNVYAATTSPRIYKITQGKAVSHPAAGLPALLLCAAIPATAGRAGQLSGGSPARSAAAAGPFSGSACAAAGGEFSR